MKMGLTLPNFGVYSDPRLLADLAHLAEASGWDGVFLTDTIQMEGYETSPVADPWIALAAIALQTERIRIGLNVAAPVRRRPWQMAREAVTIDRLSHGRLTLGVGLGDEHDRGFTAFHEDMDMKRRAAKLDETLAILAGLWSGEPFSYQGTYYRIDEIAFLPRPVQTPRIPIWIGWLWPRKRPLLRAARWDGATPFAMNDDGTYGTITADDMREMKRLIEAQRTADGPYDIVAGLPVLGVEDDAAALATLRANADAGATWALEFIEPERDLDAVRTAVRRGPPPI